VMGHVLPLDMNGKVICPIMPHPRRPFHVIGVQNYDHFVTIGDNS